MLDKEAKMILQGIVLIGALICYIFFKAYMSEKRSFLNRMKSHEEVNPVINFYKPQETEMHIKETP